MVQVQPSVQLRTICEYGPWREKVPTSTICHESTSGDQHILLELLGMPATMVPRLKARRAPLKPEDMLCGNVAPWRAS
jgi:hypothetical protein